MRLLPAVLFASLVFSPAGSRGLAHAAPILAPALGISANPARATYADVRAYLRELAAKAPRHARVVTVGASDSGQEIEALAIGEGPVKNLIVASHHGNEYGSVEVARGVAMSLVDAPIAGQTVYVIPVLNIAGYNSKSRRESGAGRSWDPNRNYPGPCGSEGELSLKSTRALADFVEREGIVASATLHTFSPAVVYPWGFTTHDLSTPYDDLFKGLVEAATVESRYTTGNSSQVIYPANGTFEDWAFWRHGVWSLLFELGSSHSPSLSQVTQMVQVNVPGIRRMLEQAPRNRAENHAFAGHCDRRLLSLDRHDE